jgi:hypothetical protein
MDLPYLLWVVAAMLAGFGIRFLVRHFSGEQRLLRRLREAPRTAIRDAAANVPLRVAGQVCADAKLLAPLSRRPCVAWQVLLERRIGAQTNESYQLWLPLAREESGDLLELRDGGGSVSFRPAGATWSLLNEIVTTLRYEADGSAETNAFLARHGIRWEGYSKPVLRFREQILEAGAGLNLFGRGQVEGAQLGGGPYRDGAARLVFAQQPLVISDRPNPLAED